MGFSCPWLLADLRAGLAGLYCSFLLIITLVLDSTGIANIKYAQVKNMYASEEM